MKYEDLLKDPRWQKRRLEIMQRDNFTCQHCGNGLNDGVPLNVHHIRYRRNLMPWEYGDADLTTLCEKCHKEEHSVETKITSNLYKVGKGKLVFFRNLLKEERLTPDGKIILSYVLTHEKTSNKRLSEILNLNRKTVISSMKKIEKLRLIEQKDYILSSGYFELKTETKLTKQLFIFYSWLYDKAYSNINGHSYNGTIDTFSCALAERFGTTKIHVRVMLSRLSDKGFVRRIKTKDRRYGKLLIL